MLKALGVLLTLAGAFGTGVCLCREQRRRAEELFSLEKFLSLAAGEISYGKTRMSPLFAEVGERIGGGLGDTLMRIGARMEDGSGLTLEEIWREEMGAYLDKTPLIKEEKELVLSFSEELGFLDGARQQRALEKLSSSIGQREQRLRQKLANQEKMTMALCMSGGIAAAILLL